MPIKEKARQDAEPIPSIVPWKDSPEPKASAQFAQDITRSVFGRNYIVVRAAVPKRNPRVTGRPKPSRIRSWRAA